ncbi:anion permease [Veillonella criceti]|uniref:Inner membrane protein ybhI n=1 Tax=Veillonella criceti TaxID=103891 RepID=A0A380NIH6_9FIRM|nr:anion permease [Veillonella criceti]SUP40276.1 Inner membrane protein ybhI [Veillonella criceti]
MKKYLSWIIPIVVGLAIWFSPVPEGLKPQAWHLFAIFAGTILGFILQPLPIGALSIISIVVSAVTNTLKIGDGLAGFANTAIWLIVAAFLFSRGFIKTGLGKRIAYTLITAVGSNSLKLSYALVLSDLILSPATPSNTARAGGVIFPITKSLASAFGSEPGPTARKIGAFLIQSIYQGNTITSAMFMTSMAGNTLVASLIAASFGYTITWGDWAVAAIVPGLAALIVMPLVLYFIYPPELKDTREIQAHIADELKGLGAMSFAEKVMLGVFILSLVLWATSQFTGLNATTVALLGVSILLISKVLTWSDVTEEKGGWDTLIWMGTMMALASQLNKLGFIPWFADLVGAEVQGINWVAAFLILLLVYTYSHYIFASLTVHITAMYVVFVAVAISAGTPPYLAMFAFAFFSNLCMSLTHYAAGPSPICFNAGYMTQNTWWRLGFIASVINLIIWLGLGSVWWKVLGLW